MAPRTYTQRKRADLTSATRDRVVDAAMAVYFEAGMNGATLTSIAQRADVSRGTILHHFGDADGLFAAVVDRILGSLQLPDEQILDGISDTEQRIRAYVAAMVAFFRRSTPWWQVFQSEMERPAAKAQEAAYYERIGRLQASALGPELAADSAVQAAVGAVLYPSTMGSMLWVLESAGTPPDEATRVIEDMVIGFLDVHGGSSLEPGERSVRWRS
jgi:AcrR family transcriptional regulator